MAVANQAGLPTVALITDMDRVLGRNVGNAVEVVETVEYLKGEGTRDPRLHEVTMALAGEMVALGGLAPDAAAGRARAEAALADGRAAEVFARMVAALGGPDDFLEHSARYLAHASVIRPCNAERSGHVAGMDARQVGIAVVALGGGRAHADDAIDPSVGLTDVDRCRHAGPRRQPAVHRARRQRRRCRPGDRDRCSGRSASRTARRPNGRRSSIGSANEARPRRL